MAIDSHASSDITSPAARQLREGIHKLRFEGALEQEFRRDYIDQNVRRVRWALYLAIVFIGVFCLLDWFTHPQDLAAWVVSIRMGIMYPVLILPLIATFEVSLKRYLTALMIVASLAVGGVAVAIDLAAHQHGISYFFSSLILFSVYVYFFTGLRCEIAIATSMTVYFAYLAVTFSQLPTLEYFYNSLFLLSANLGGAIGCYVLEHALRTHYLESRMLNEQAERDGLTGLYNRRMFDEHFQRLWNQAQRNNNKLAVLLVDIDYFKMFNDMYGHQAGDDCLRQVAETFAESARRPFDIAARYGGEEFVIVLFDPPVAHAEDVAQEMRRAIEELRILHRGSHVSRFLTASVGAAIAVPEEGRRSAGLLQLADEALYEAKESGRNRIIVKAEEYEELDTGAFRQLRAT
ncbi:MAG: diguanylate cyclase [Gammaproteobacteria bacterium]